MEKTVSSKRFKKRKLYPIEEYYAVVDPMEINKIRVDIYYPPKTLSQRKEAYKKHKKTKILFTLIVYKFFFFLCIISYVFYFFL